MKTVGIDEVGRGAWAGPLVMAAVRFNGKPIEGLGDSKRLSRHSREVLAVQIAKSSDFAIIFFDAPEVDRIGLTACLKKGALRLAFLLNAFDEKIIIDGNYNLLLGTKYEKLAVPVIKADSLYPEVMAASIIAKVSRDTYMTYVHDLDKFKRYSFCSHVGYGTQTHKDAIVQFGVSALHRLSFKPIKLALEVVSGND